MNKVKMDANNTNNLVKKRTLEENLKKKIRYSIKNCLKNKGLDEHQH